MADVTVDHGAVARLAAPGGPVAAGLGRLAERVADVARDGAPGRTGRLRASIHPAPLPDGGWAVVAGVEYAHRIEMAQPFLGPALASVVAP